MGSRREVRVTEVATTDRHLHNHHRTASELFENIDFQ